MATETRSVTFTGDYAVDQPTLGLSWIPGKTQEVDASRADTWDADPDSSFSGSRKKAAREARGAAEAQAQQEHETQTVEQPATDAVQEG